jgi:tetratricopeptide (TPR) repeat protein
LANLYQVAREYDRAIPVIQKQAKLTDSGKAYERLGRSFFELGKYADAEKALRTGLSKGKMKDPGYAWVLIGQIKHKADDREAARKAFKNASKLGARGGEGWLSFMDSEDITKEALRTFDTRVKLDELINLKKSCKQIEVLGGEPPEGCKTVEADLIVILEKLEYKDEFVEAVEREGVDVEIPVEFQNSDTDAAALETESDDA